MLPSLEKSDVGQSPDYKTLNLKPKDQKTASPKEPDGAPKHQVRMSGFGIRTQNLSCKAVWYPGIGE